MPGDPPWRSRVSVRTTPTAMKSPGSASVRTRAPISTRPATSFPQGRTLDQFPLERLVGAGSRRGLSSSADRDSGPPRPAPAPRSSPPPSWPSDCGRSRSRSAAWSYCVPRALCSRSRPHSCSSSGGVGLVGTDSAGLDDEPYPVHRLLLGSDVLLAENLWGLDRLEPGPVTCACLPLALVGSGRRAREGHRVEIAPRTRGPAGC